MATSRNIQSGSFALSAIALSAIVQIAGTAIASQALAQSGSVGTGGNANTEDQLHGSYSQPLGTVSAASQAGGAGGGGGQQASSTVRMYESNDGDTFSLTINNGTISAEHNGKPVPPDQIELKENSVVIKDKDGKTIKTFDVGVVNERMHGSKGISGSGLSGVKNLRFNSNELDPSVLDALRIRGALMWNDAGENGADVEGQAGTAEEEPPPVMVGITMSDVDSSVLEHLSLEEGAAFSIDRVIDGLPAEKGGLKPHDVVTAIDGQTPATQAKFREILRGKKAGEHLELKIIRQGKPDTVTLDLIAYDASKLGASRARAWGEGDSRSGGKEGQVFQFGPSGSGSNNAGSNNAGSNNAWSNDAWSNNAWSAEARKKIEEALAEIKNNPDLQPEKLKAESQRALEEALKALTQTRDVFRNRWQSYRDGVAGNAMRNGGRADVFVAPNEAQPFIRMRPQGGGDAGDQSAKRLERLNNQLDRLDKRLDELEKRLEKNDHK